MVRLRAPLNVPPDSVTSGSVVAGVAPSSVSVPLSSVSAAGSSVAPLGSVTLAVVRTSPAPPTRPFTVRMPASVSSAPASARKAPASVATAGAAATDSVPCAAWTVPSLSSRVETVEVPGESFSSRPPAATWTWPLPLLQTKPPAAGGDRERRVEAQHAAGDDADVAAVPGRGGADGHRPALDPQLRAGGLGQRAGRGQRCRSRDRGLAQRRRAGDGQRPRAAELQGAAALDRASRRSRSGRAPRCRRSRW